MKCAFGTRDWRGPGPWSSFARMSDTSLRRLLDQPLPDLTLPSTRGGTFSLRARVGTGPQVFFFFIRSGTPL